MYLYIINITWFGLAKNDVMPDDCYKNVYIISIIGLSTL